MKFSDEKLRQALIETRAQLPAGHTNAMVGVIDDHGVQVVAGMVVADGHIEITGAFEHAWTGENSGRAQVLVSW